MFYGSVCLNKTVPLLSFSGEYKGNSHLDRLAFTEEGFVGVCDLQLLLPYRREDVFFHDKHRDILVMLSGSVYNKSEILNMLGLSAGIPEPEMIAEMFISQGTGFVKELNGDFAVFIFRARCQEAFLFRDHLGIRPLAWTVKDETLHFSTDISEFSRAFGSSKRIDNEYLLGYFKYIDYRKTPDPGIKKVPPGHFLRYAVDGTSITKYWEPEKTETNRKLTYDTMLSELDALLHDAVRIRCDGRFTAGAHVSGGLDSGVISALVRKEYSPQKEFYGFSWSPSAFDGRGVKHDERKAIIDSCSDADITPVFSGMTVPDYIRYLSRSWYNSGYFNEDESSDGAVRRGVNLMFSGWGGDEFISTGHSGIDLDLLRRLKLRLFFRRNSAGSLKKFIRHLLFYVVYPALHILSPGSLRGFRRDARYILKEFARSDRRAVSSFYFHGSRRQMHLNVFRFYNIPERCESWHRLGFYKGLEYRYPLLDRRIIEYVMKIPSELLCRTGHFRPLLRELGAGILSDDVRLDEDKNDPLFWEHMDKLNREASLEIMNEAESWQDNPDMGFVDYSLLLKDIYVIRSNGSVSDERILFRTLVWLKAISEFTVSYRKGGIE